ncbi:FAD-binding and (Fe-S)-binding domain-containing protein [Amycolatopsis pigmentata]|uniref:FAD-binding and (Fe-S)-binding domain-containing protein n=1 Tax=Amycolatopsis pigmentata TaxID=450801 RepID=A0ABW5FM59_9PSEU
MTTSGVLNRGALAAGLAARVAGEVRFDEGSRALYANDASIYRQVPVGVVIPRDAGDVAAALAVCREHGAPVMARGGGTGLAGQTVNDAVAFDFSKYMNRVLEIDPDRRTARVQPGLILDHLRHAAGEHGLTFSVDPATHDRCTLGGMIGNNSCGTHSQRAGKTVDNVLSLDVITYDGLRMTVGPTPWDEYQRILAEGGRRADIYRRLRALAERHAKEIRFGFPNVPRRVSGFNLDDLLDEKGFNVARALVGSESTCVLVVEATVRLLSDPPNRSLLVAGFPDAATAADHVPELADTGVIGLECFDAGVIDNLHKHGIQLPGMDELPEGGAWLLAEYAGETRAETDAEVERAAKLVTEPGVTTVVEDPRRQGEIWEIRRSTIEYTRIPGEHAGLALWEDAGVAPERLGDYIRDYCALVTRHGYHTVLFGHFGQGCMHNRLDADLTTAAGVENFERFLDEAGDLVARYGGSLSGEHGDGQLRANQLTKIFGSDLVGAFAEFKRIWDPEGRMNPGKVVHPYPPGSNLATGPAYRPRSVRTHFAYPDDENGFADAANRCFGIGLCRHTSGGTMCPSFMVTREEKHSTRGRARMLFEMMNGHLAPDSHGKGWRDEHVKDALDLCLACKGCKGDCPVGVDMATYKAEFLAHYYRGRLRPRSAYALGLIPVWARLAARVPHLANGVLGTPVLGRAARWAAGVAPRREVPRFAHRTFRSAFAGHQGRPLGRPVVLWPDTFTNYFTPDIGMAAVQALEAAGFTVTIPDAVLCCGRPLFDYGMLPTAKRWLRRVLDALRPALTSGVPIVVLEPSCLAVFRDELRNLFPHDAAARRLAGQARSLAELLTSGDYEPPRLNRKALVQGHCHQQAVIGTEADTELLEAMGLDLARPDSGCCGMAGSFGYERGEHYDVSMAAGERVILPAVREADDATLILADGFSCRSQIASGTHRRALHLAEVLTLPDGG